MDLDSDLARELERAIPHLPTASASSHLSAGRRARRRRQAYAGVAGAAVLALTAGGALSVLGGPGSTAVDERTAASSSEIPDWAQEYGNHGPASIYPDGRLWVAPDARLIRKVDNPLDPGDEDVINSYAVEAEMDGELDWSFVYRVGDDVWGEMGHPGEWTNDDRRVARPAGTAAVVRRTARRRHDLRGLCQPHRAEAEQDRRRVGDRELRDGEGVGRLHRPGDRRRRDRRRRAGRLHRDAARAAAGRAGPRRRRSGSRTRRVAHPAAGLPDAHGPGRRHGDGSGAAVHLVAVGVADARRAGGGVGRAAVPPRGVVQPATRRRHDGHPRVDRDARRVRLVALRPVPRRRRCTGPARIPSPSPSTGRTAPRTSTSRSPRASRRSCWPVATPRPARGGGPVPRCRPCSGSRRRTPRSSGTAARSGSRSTGWWSATGSSCGRATRWPPTASSSRAPRRSTRAC